MDIIQRPDVTTSPFIYNFNIGVFNSPTPGVQYTARDFTTMCKVEKIKDTYIPAGDKPIRGRRRKKIESTVFTLAIIPEVILSVFGSPIALSILLITSLLAAMVAFGEYMYMASEVIAYSDKLFYHYTYEYAYSNLTKSEKKLLEHAEYIALDSDVVDKLHTIAVDDLDTAALHQAYNDYIELDLFVRANEDVISSHALDAYYEELEKRETQFIACIDEQISIVQEMRDVKALSAMPVPIEKHLES